MHSSPFYVFQFVYTSVGFVLCHNVLVLSPEFPATDFMVSLLLHASK